MSTLREERLKILNCIKKLKYELAGGRNHICIEEETVIFFSTTIKYPVPICCELNSKSITLFLFNPVIFSCFSRLRHANILNHLCPLMLKNKKPNTCPQPQPTLPSISVRKYFSSEVFYWCRLHNHVSKFQPHC